MGKVSHVNKDASPGDAPLGIYPATLVARAWNSPITIVLYFATRKTGFCLSVRAKHGFAPRFGGPSFEHAPLQQVYILAVRVDRSKQPVLDYAMLLSSENECGKYPIEIH